MHPSGEGCIGPESTTALYVPYGETAVHTYLYILYLSPVWIPSTVLPHLNQRRLISMGRTLFPSMASIARP